MTQNRLVLIDGSVGEGGGQILRTSLALSAITGKPFRMDQIRAKRSRPGLLRQHLTSIEAAVAICGGTARGAAIGSSTLVFEPGSIRPGTYHFAVGTAGSTTLVLQTVLPALALAGGPSVVTLEGGTHNPFAPPFDFLDRAFLPLLGRMGPHVVLTLERPGFYPAGGGRLVARIEPVSRLEPLELLDRGAVQRKTARAIVSGLPLDIGHRELRALARRITIDPRDLRAEAVQNPLGPGNVLLVEVESEHVTEVFTGFGERGVSCERVAQGAAEQVREYLAAGVPVGAHLADQLLVPLALAGGGAFVTLPPTGHTTTNVEVIQRLLGVEIKLASGAGRTCNVQVKKS